MRRVLLIARKDMKEGFGQRALILRVALPAIVLPILYGVVTGIMIRSGDMDPDQAGFTSGMIWVFAAVVAVVGTSTGGVMAAQAIVQERVRRTIESLLATPASDWEIFAGKVLAAFLPGVAAGYGAGLLYFVSARALCDVAPLAVPGVVFFTRFIALLLPTIVAIEVAAGVTISGRCGTVTGATQASALTSIPVIGATLYLAYRAREWPLSEVFAHFIGLALLAVALLYLGARAMGREEIIARLD